MENDVVCYHCGTPIYFDENKHRWIHKLTDDAYIYKCSICKTYGGSGRCRQDGCLGYMVLDHFARKKGE